MELPDYLHGIAQDNLNNEGFAIEQRYQAERKRNQWAVIYGLIPYKDGNQWCVLLGENIQDGICGFGDTPVAAIYEFDKEMGF